jgi:hypothetical protein
MYYYHSNETIDVEFVCRFVGIECYYGYIKEYTI